MNPNVFVGIPYQKRLKFRKRMEILNREPEFKHDLDKLMDVVCRYLELDKSKFLSKTRIKKYAEGRHFYCFIARKLTDNSLAKIGLTINRDHSNVVHSCKRVTDWIEFDKETANEIKEIEALYKELI